MNSYLGIDTSNYTTSVALLLEDGRVEQVKKTLPVEQGSIGLRQNEAIFHHVNDLPKVLDELLSKFKGERPTIIAIGASTRPRNREGSYMPCFNVGNSLSESLSLLLNVPNFKFSHQEGHIMASIYSQGCYEILNDDFLAFHVSGGTTEALHITAKNGDIEKIDIVGKTLDLNAGQLIDRAGVMLGLAFPAGRELEKLAVQYTQPTKVRAAVKGENICLSGGENICKKMYLSGESKRKVARTCIDYVLSGIDNMCKTLLLKYGKMPIIFSGGVSSNSIIRNALHERYGALFANPEFSSDNAVGIAVLTKRKLEEK